MSLSRITKTQTPFHILHILPFSIRHCCSRISIHVALIVSKKSGVVKSTGRKQLQIPRRAEMTICRDNGGVQSNCWDMTCGFVVVVMVGYIG
uniref:Uncharacterized protein n=1 Tax=Helianthus annuus TaxID=4232 RepID=A0A251SLY9_HELAN